MATSDKRTLLTEVPKAGVYPDIETFKKLEPERQKRDKELLTDAISETKDARQKALLNAHEALVNAFGPKVEQMLKKDCEAPKQQLTEDTTTVLTMDDLESMLDELGMELADDDMVKECRQRLDEAKEASPTEKEKMYKDIHRKFWAYVQGLPTRKVTEISTPSDTDKAVKKFLTNKHGTIEWISYEGSVIMSALAAVSDSGGTTVNLSQLPDDDKGIVKSILGNRILGAKLESTYIFFRLDEYKNFDCSVPIIDNGKTDMKFTLGNRVASIPPNEATGRGNDVKVERKGKDIVIGDRIKLEKNRIQNLVNQPDPTNNGANRGGTFAPRQKVAGRNAYEIRADVLEMALDFARNSENKKLDADDVLDIAEAFYGFVEHK